MSLQSFTLHGREVPILKMLKRQVRNFRSGRRASVTLVFRASMPVIIRWFRLAPRLNMATSEVPNMLPVEGMLRTLWLYKLNLYGLVLEIISTPSVVKT